MNCQLTLEDKTRGIIVIISMPTTQILVVYAKKNVTIHQKALCCASCSLMVHIKCNSTTLEEYTQIQDANDGLTDEEIQAKKWKCSKCVILDLAKISHLDNKAIMN